MLGGELRERNVLGMEIKQGRAMPPIARIGGSTIEVQEVSAE